MNRRQKAILVDISTVVVITTIAVAGILNMRDYFNRREARMAMMVIGERVKQYRAEHGLVPSESWVDSQREDLVGNVRLVNFHYLGRWIDLDSDPDEILAYTQNKSRSPLFEDGYLVLRLKEVLSRDKDVKVNIEWLKEKEFEDLLSKQLRQLEIEMLRK